MSYTADIRSKHQELIEKEMEAYTPQQRGQVMSEFIKTWPDDKEATEIIKRHKSTIVLEATPEETEEAFKNLRV